MTTKQWLGPGLALVTLLAAGCATRAASPADAMMVRLDVVERALGATESDLRARQTRSASPAPSSWSEARRAIDAADAALTDAREGVSIWQSGDGRHARPRLEELSRRLDAVRSALLGLGVAPSPGLLEVLEPPPSERANTDAGALPPPHQG